MKVLIDNGHGSDTKGKSSPDKSVREYAWTREIAARVVDALLKLGVDASLVTPEETDIPLQQRVIRINRQCAQHGSKNVLLVSIHNNAARDDGSWEEKASGWGVFVSKNASDNSKSLAEYMFRIAKEKGILGNRATPKPDANGNHYSTWSWTDKDIYILKASNCPAVLTENMFMDNRADCRYLLSEHGKEEITQLHVDGIMQYIKANK